MVELLVAIQVINTMYITQCSKTVMTCAQILLGFFFSCNSLRSFLGGFVIIMSCGLNLGSSGA